MDKEIEIENFTKNLISITKPNHVPMPNCLIDGRQDEHIFGFAATGIWLAWENIIYHKSLRSWEFTFSGCRGRCLNTPLEYKEILDAISSFKKAGKLITSRFLNNKIIYRWDPLKLYNEAAQVNSEE